MVQTKRHDENYTTEKSRFQFSLRRMLLLTVFCAALAGMVSAIDAPFLRGVLTFCLFAFAAYIMLRLPYLWLWIVRRTPEWEQFRHRRADLEAEVRAAKRDIGWAKPPHNKHELESPQPDHPDD